MKKLFLTIAIVIGMASVASAQIFGISTQPDGGLFNRETTDDPNSGTPILPDHNQDGNQDAAPLGSGVLLLTGMGAAYALSKKRQKVTY